jgi:hypothetical protein
VGLVNEMITVLQEALVSTFHSLTIRKIQGTSALIFIRMGVVQGTTQICRPTIRIITGGRGLLVDRNLNFGVFFFFFFWVNWTKSDFTLVGLE